MEGFELNGVEFKEVSNLVGMNGKIGFVFKPLSPEHEVEDLKDDLVEYGL